jgi:hypothetical protein
MAAGSNVELKHAVLRFYREELCSRYQLENVRRFNDFKKVSDTQIVALRDFFMERIYPEPEERDQLDAAFDQLGHMLRSPMRMQPLVGAALASLWRMGHRIPSAIGAGRATIDAYLKTRILESEMMEEAKRLKFKEKDFAQREQMIRLIKAVPEEQVMQLIKDILSLFHALSNVEMLQVAAQFMRECKKVMENRHDLYSDADREGVALGLGLLEQGLALFLSVKKEEFPAIIEGINQLELDWYARVMEEAKHLT